MTECKFCSELYCRGCVNMKACDDCGGFSCGGVTLAKCGDCLHTCNGCNRTRCKECSPFLRCVACLKEHCRDCYNGEEYDVKACWECGGNYCSTCKVEKRKANQLDGCC